jgi:hypothetical protein
LEEASYERDIKNLLLFEQETSENNMKVLKSFVRTKSPKNLVIISTFCYFTGERPSKLFLELIAFGKNFNKKLIF